MNRWITGGTIALCAALVAVPATAATAATAAPKTLAQIQAAGATAIANRQNSLTAALAELAEDHTISSADRASITATLTGDQGGLATLGQHLAADTTVSAAGTDYHSIFATYRVYALALPQARLAAASDALTSTVVPGLTDAQQQLERALSVEPAKNTPSVQAAMTDLGQRIGDIGAKTSGLSGTVLAYTPAQYDADHALLAPARSAILAAGSDVSAARADISTVLAALGLRSPAPSASGSAQ